MENNALQNVGRPPQMMGNVMPPNPPYVNIQGLQPRSLPMGMLPSQMMNPAGAEKRK